MKDIRQAIKNGRLYFDGGFGTVLQSMGLGAGERPESWNILHPEKVVSVHKAYVDAGSNIITTNTFGINRDKYENYEELISSAVRCAREAAEERDTYIAFDIGPTGRMLEPIGDMSFDEAVDLFAANVRAAVSLGVDLILIETMNDSYETKAAVLAAKENCDLPIFVTNVYDKSGKLMTGADPLSMIAMLEGMGVSAIGMNCSFGPDVMLEIIDSFTENTSLPIITNPNAGLPQVADGKTVYNISADEFADYMEKLAKKGVSILGGCCGTTPEYIRETVKRTKDIPLPSRKAAKKTLVSSYTHAVQLGDAPVLIGERINPTGKARLKDALRRADMSYLLGEAIKQSEAGVQILDVNVGLPEINEKEMMCAAVKAIQAVTDTPLQIDSSSPTVLEGAMRVYNGKPLINSVNGKEESLDAVLPLVKKYGGTLIALTMDGSGIPETAEGRVAIARKIAGRAKEYGIEKEDIIVDPLCLTVSSDRESALVTLDALRMLKEEGFVTSLGVSNVSFGLPEREKINTAFFACALERGLDCAIMNPYSRSMMDTYYAFLALHGKDPMCQGYIDYALAQPNEKKSADVKENMTLHYAILKGLKDSASDAAEKLLGDEDGLSVINGHIVPALSEVGKLFEEKRLYLPQLLMSAEAASAAFEKVKERMPKGEAENGSIILATVKGDIHDIGKNIVRVLLESHGFTVYDLGKDVPPEKVCEAVRRTGCEIVGLSALMTTTVPAMEETIKLLRKEHPNTKVIVGGAVMTQEYADMIGADVYCADAMAAVKFLQRNYK